MYSVVVLNRCIMSWNACEQLDPGAAEQVSSEERAEGVVERLGGEDDELRAQLADASVLRAALASDSQAKALALQRGYYDPPVTDCTQMCND